MKRLRQYIRNILLSEMAMNQSADLPPGWAFACKINGAYGMPQIMLVGPDGFVQHKKMKVECFFAKITAFKEDPGRSGDWIDDKTKEELGYDCYDLRRLDSNPSGFGPLITDIAMEWVTSMGGILFPDRRDMSVAAQGMWDKYAAREGVEQFVHPQLGTSGYRRKLNTVLELEANEQVYLEKRNHDTNTQEKSKLSKSI